MTVKKSPGKGKKDRLSRPLQDLSPGELLDLVGKTQLRYLDLVPRDSLEEKIAYLVLEGQGEWGELGAVFDRLLEAIRRYSTQGIRTVVFGGGTGLSSILGGDTALAGWSESPFGGLKRYFPDFTVSVCATDDGGSSGRLLRSLPCIALDHASRPVVALPTPVPSRVGDRRGFPATDPELPVRSLPGFAGSEDTVQPPGSEGAKRCPG